MELFRGSGVAIATPYKRDSLEVDYEEFARLIEEQIAGGTDAIIVCGTTGEAATMSHEEHVEVCRFCVEKVAGRVPVIAGSGSNNTAASVQISEEMRRIGADGVLIVAPYYNKGTQKGVYAHIRTIAEAVHLPVVIYNVPSRTGGNILPETIAALAKDVPEVVAVKEASGNISQIVKLMQLTDGSIDVYSGNDDQVVPLMAMGAKGVISVVANVAPRVMHDMCAKFFAGDVAGAAKLQCDIIPLYEKLFCEVNPIPVKKALEFLGYKSTALRLPLTEMESAHAEQLRKEMEAFGLL